MGRRKKRTIRQVVSRREATGCIGVYAADQLRCSKAVIISELVSDTSQRIYQ